jgi:hypothetical protein
MNPTPTAQTQHPPVLEAACAAQSGAGRLARSSVPLSDAERRVLTLLLRHAKDGGEESLTVPLVDVAGAAGLDPEDARATGAVLRTLAGRVVEWRTGDSRTIAPLLAEVRIEGPDCRCVLSPALHRRVSPEVGRSQEGDALSSRLAEFGLTEAQVERALRFPSDQIERNLAYVEDELAGGKEIGSLGAYTYRAVQGDWGGSAEAARRKRTAVARRVADRTRAAWQAVFPPPALARDRAVREAEAAEDRRLDEHVSGLTEAEKVDLDDEVIRRLRARSHPGVAEVEKAVASEAEGDLGPAALGALTAGRRDVMAEWLRRGTLAVVLALSASVGGCSRDVPADPAPTGAGEHLPVASPLLGVWDLADVGRGFGECHEASIGFRSDGRYLAKSGDQVVTGRYVAEEAVVDGRMGFLVVQRPEVHNGRPNCQGVPAEVSLATSPPAAFVEVEAGGGAGRSERARLYLGGQVARPAVHLVRRTLHD